MLQSVSLELKKGESIALIGPNGSGKTTLIKAILQLVIADEGDILVDGRTIYSDVNYKARIGYMPQMSRLPEGMTVGQLFSMMKKLRNDVKPEVYDEEIYREFKIKKMSRKSLGKLSGGMRQQVNAALAFLFNPEILILDEPTASLDPVSSEILKEKITRSTEAGKLVLITSHNLNDLDGLVGRIVYLMEGRVLFDEGLEALKANTSESRLNKMIVETLSQKLPQ